MKEIKWAKFAICLGISMITWFSFDFNGHETIVSNTAFSAMLLASLWISESINIYITSLLPLLLFPLMGIMDIKDVAPQYTQQIIFLFIGGFLMAYALEKVNLHKRMALWLILKLGSSPQRILLSFMLSAYVLSMWIVNTATTIMLLPAALSVIKEIKKQNTGESKIEIAILLGIAYSASIGGTATIIGTAPNSYFLQFFNDNFQSFPPITFTSWLSVAFPISLVLFVSAYFLFTLLFIRKQEINVDLGFCRKSYNELGKFSIDELKVSIVFIISILLWLFRKDINTPLFSIGGWSKLEWIPQGSFLTDSSVAMLAAITLFLIPTSKNRKTGIIEWKDVQKLPLGILFLFGAGFALAKSFDISGLSEIIANELNTLGNLDPVIIVLCLCVFMTFFTEITSNTASTMLLLPVLSIMVKNNGLDPLQILLPVTLSASFAFMLPVATPPNTVVFGTELIPIKSMIRYGFWLNLMGIVIVSILSYFLI